MKNMREIHVGVILAFGKLCLRLGQHCGHHAANRGLIRLAGKIGRDLAHNIFMARFLEISADDVHRIGFCIGTCLAQQPCGPQTKFLVSAGNGLENHFLIMGKFVFKCAFAVVQGCHCGPHVGLRDQKRSQIIWRLVACTAR